MHGVNMVALFGLLIAWWVALAIFCRWVNSRPIPIPRPVTVELDVDLSDLDPDRTLRSSRPAELAAEEVAFVRSYRAAESVRRWRASIPEVVEPAHLQDEPTAVVDVRALRAG